MPLSWQVVGEAPCHSWDPEMPKPWPTLTLLGLESYLGM